ncbi:MAG: hypothetical protein R2878_14330 [Thermoleophilia bacterium]
MSTRFAVLVTSEPAAALVANRNWRRTDGPRAPDAASFTSSGTPMIAPGQCPAGPADGDVQKLWSTEGEGEQRARSGPHRIARIQDRHPTHPPVGERDAEWRRDQDDADERRTDDHGDLRTPVPKRKDRPATTVTSSKRDAGHPPGVTDQPLPRATPPSVHQGELVRQGRPACLHEDARENPGQDGEYQDASIGGPEDPGGHDGERDGGDRGGDTTERHAGLHHLALATQSGPDGGRRTAQTRSPSARGRPAHGRRARGI